MCQVDHVHDAKDECQPGGQQEQHQAELQPVQQLLGDQGERQPFPLRPSVILSVAKDLIVIATDVFVDMP